MRLENKERMEATRTYLMNVDPGVRNKWIPQEKDGVILGLRIPQKRGECCDSGQNSPLIVKN